MRTFYTCLSFSAVFTLTACGHSTMPSVGVPTIPANLAQPCVWPTELRDGQGGTVLRWAVRNVQAHRECANRHQELVEAWPK